MSPARNDFLGIFIDNAKGGLVYREDVTGFTSELSEIELILLAII